MGWSEHLSDLSQCLSNLIVTDRQGLELEQSQGFLQCQRRAEQLREAGQTLYLAGNGASASMASHYSADLAKNGKLRTQVFTDMSLITALSNDIAYGAVFSEPLSWWMKPGDMFVGISSSGNSPNVVNAAKVAREKGGFVVTLSAMKPDNALRQLGDMNFYVPASTYGLAETSHNALMHYWVDLMVGDATIEQQVRDKKEKAVI